MNTRIKELRKELKLNQTEFGEKIGATLAMMTSYERGKVIPDEAKQLLICKTFGVRLEWLKTGELPKYPEEVQDGPEALVPDLVGILGQYPAVLEMMQKVVSHMTADDWQRLNQLLKDIQNENTPKP